MRYFLLLVCIIALTLSGCTAQLKFDRFWLVDVHHGDGFKNYLYRGNLPVENDEFALDTLIKYAQIRSDEYSLPPIINPYIIDISFLTIDQNEHEMAFFNDPANAHIGEYINWPLGIAGLIPPKEYTEVQRRELANSTVWDFDKIPQRMLLLRDMMTTPGPIDPATGKPRPKLIFGHCAAGVDRTGQVMLGWRLFNMPLAKLTPNTIHELYELNTEEAGRCPNYYSTHATEWYCVWYSMNMGDIDIGNCLHLADCKPFGHCCRDD